MRAKTSIRLALAAVLALCFSQAVVATTYYVNPGKLIQAANDGFLRNEDTPLAMFAALETILIRNPVL